LYAWLEATTELFGLHLLAGARADVLALRVRDSAVGDGRLRRSLGTHLGAKLGVERVLSERWSLFLNYGDGFRSPQARGLEDGERTPFVSVRGGELGAAF